MSDLNQQLVKMNGANSLFEQAVRKNEIPVCKQFKKNGKIFPAAFVETGKVISTVDNTEIFKDFPQTTAQALNKLLEARGFLEAPAQIKKKVAVLFSGGPAPGGHNVIAGIKNMLAENCQLFGVRKGPKGLLAGDLFEITDEDIARILNTGGFGFLGTDRTKLKTEEQFKQVAEICRQNELDALVIIGGDDSNTNAAVLAEKLFQNVHADGRGVQVIGVPKTIDGDLQYHDKLPISFGFDTATKTYSELVGNILKDTNSSCKYYHFVKLMGRAASHVSLEVGLQTRPAAVLIGEEIQEKNISLAQIIDDLAKIVLERKKYGIEHGLIIIPEGLIEFIPEMKTLLVDLAIQLDRQGARFAKCTDNEKIAIITGELAEQNANFMRTLPAYVQKMLVADRDAHGNIPVSDIPTERLIKDLLQARVLELDPNFKIGTHTHFLGYKGRCGAPTLFDAAYTYNLGLAVASLILGGKTGYMVSLSNLTSGGLPLAIPLTGMLTVEKRNGHDEVVIEKDLIKLDSPAFKFFEKCRYSWSVRDAFDSPGPIQFWGPVSRNLPITVALNQGYDDLEFKIGK